MGAAAVRRRLLSVLLVALAVSACSGGSSPSVATAVASAASSPARAVELQVYAAASLTSALDKVKTAYEAANPGITLTISTDSSTALETKIEQGAPADVLLSADTANPQKLVDKGLASGSMTLFAGNKLTVIVPTGNPAGIAAPQDLARAGVKVIACTDGVPIQKYTALWLDKVKALPAYGADFPARYAANVVSREDNVSGIVTKVGLGEGDAGVVYVSDAKTSDKVATIDIPDAENVSASYGGVVVKASPNQSAAAAFLGWLAGPDGQAILATFGFLAPSR